MNIRDFHAHVYFDATTRPAAERVREDVARVFGAKVGTVHDRPVGPHPKPMFQITIAVEQFAAVVPWLMMNRGGLTICVHPTTDDPVADHDTHPMWMGEALPIDVEMIRDYVAKKKSTKSEKNENNEEASR